MTETTEEISEIERAQKLATLATEALYDEKKKVAELKRELEGLKFKAKDHAHQVNAIIQAKNKFQDENEALTKEIDELADRVRNLKETAAVAVKDNRSLRSQLSNREKEIEELKQNFDKTEFFYFVEDEEQLGSPNDVAEYWDCPIGGTLDIQSCKVFFQPTQTYIRTEKGMVPVQPKEGEEE